MNDLRLSAIRGATGCSNVPEEIKRHITDLYDEILSKNGLQEGDIVSIMFTVTEDLVAINPATALRQSGRAAELALFSAQESAVLGGRLGLVRMLIHCYLRENKKPHHVYIHGAEILRPDRVEK